MTWEGGCQHVAPAQSLPLQSGSGGRALGGGGYLCPAFFRMARGLDPIKRLEGTRGEVGAPTATVSSIESALKTAGIEILSNGGPGVRLKE